MFRFKCYLLSISFPGPFRYITGAESWLHSARPRHVHLDPVRIHFRADTRYDGDAVGVWRFPNGGNEGPVSEGVFLCTNVCFSFPLAFNIRTIVRYPRITCRVCLESCISVIWAAQHRYGESRHNDNELQIHRYYAPEHTHPTSIRP